MITFSSAFIGMRTPINISNNFFKYSREQVAKLVGNILFILSVSTLLFTTLTFIFTLFFGEIFSIPSNWLHLIPILSFMFMVNRINLTILRNEGKAYIFGIFERSITAINIGVTIILIIFYQLGWHSRALGITVAYFLFFIIGMIYMKKRNYLSFEIDKSEIKSIVFISIPLIPHALDGTVITMSDRPFIGKMVSLEMVGIYSNG